MQTESMPLGEAKMNPEQQPDRQKEMFLQHLKDEIWQAAQEMNVELSVEELRVAWQGADTEEEDWVPFKLGERAARLAVRAQESFADSQDRRLSRARSLALSAAAYLRGAPETAAECLQYARDVWEGERLWDEKDIPQPIPAVGKEEEEGGIRRAA